MRIYVGFVLYTVHNRSKYGYFFLHITITNRVIQFPAPTFGTSSITYDRCLRSLKNCLSPKIVVRCFDRSFQWTYSPCTSKLIFSVAHFYCYLFRQRLFFWQRMNWCAGGSHWLRVSEGIDYKIAVLTYRVLHGGAPRYLGTLTSVVDLPSRRALRSAVTNRLDCAIRQTVNCGQPSFSGCRPWIWNSLPEHVVTAATLQSFKKHLKTFLLQRSYSLAL